MINTVNSKGGQRKKLMVRRTKGAKLEGDVRRYREGGRGRPEPGMLGRASAVPGPGAACGKKGSGRRAGEEITGQGGAWGGDSVCRWWAWGLLTKPLDREA